MSSLFTKTEGVFTVRPTGPPVVELHRRVNAPSP